MLETSKMSGEENIGSPPSGDKLEFALAIIREQLKGWNGVPSTTHLGQALRHVRTAYAACVTGNAEQPFRNFLSEGMSGPSRIQHGNNLAVLDAVIAALEGGTGDGWTLRLFGGKGPRATSEDFDRDWEIATFMTQRMAEGDFYESAVADAKIRFDCGASKIGDAYSEYKWFVDYITKIGEKSPEQAMQMLARARSSPRN